MTGAKSTPVSLYVYFTLWCLYSLQGPLYPTGSIIAKILLLILLVWSIVVMFKVNMHERNKPQFFSALNTFLLVTTMYGVLLILSGQELYITEIDYIKTSNTDYLKQIYISLLPIFVFYYYTKKGYVSPRNILLFILVLLLINIICFFHTRAQSMILAIQNGRNVDGVTLNVGYKFLALFPLILLYNRKPFYQYIVAIVTLLFVILCMKRGAILIAVFCFLYFIYNTLRSSKGKNKFIVTFMAIMALLATIFLVTNLLNTSDYFVQRIQQTLDGDASNREDVYSTLLHHFFSEHNFFRFMFGNGANATLKVGMNYAHNDWLELAINQGVVGLLLYVWYYIALFVDYIKIKKFNKNYANVLMMALIVMFASSMFSMSYASLDRAMAIALGFVLAQLHIVPFPGKGTVH